MFERFANLVLAVDSRDVKKSTRDVDKLADAGKKAERVTDSIGRTAKVAFGLFAAGATASGFALNAVLRNTRTQERAMAQLRQAFKTTGDTAELSVEKVAAFASELQSVTTFGDEQFIEAASQLKTFTGIIDDEFRRTIELSADLSVRFGQDLKSSVLQLGKALNDPIANLGALGRSGIQFSAAQQKVIKSLAETGRLAEAQKIILAELDVQFGGSARAARNEFGGALEGLQNTLGDLLEADSDSLPALTDSVNDLNAVFSDPELVKGIQGLSGELLGLIGVFARVIVEGRGFVRFLAEELSAAINGPASDDLPRLQDELDKVTKSLEDLTLASSKNYDKHIAGAIESLKRQKAGLESIIELEETRLANNAQLSQLQPIDLSQIPDKLPTISQGVVTTSDKAANDETFSLQDQIVRNLSDLSQFQQDRKEQAITAAQEEAEALLEIERGQNIALADIMEGRRNIRFLELDALQQVASLIASTSKEGSAAQKVAFVAQQGIAAATAIINAESAAAAALAPPPIGVGPVAGATYAQVIRALGYASAGVIAGQTIGQFHSGGTVPFDGTYALKGGEEILTRQQSKEIKVAGGNNVIVQNFGSPSDVRVETRNGPEGQEQQYIIFKERLKSDLTQDVMRGGNEFMDAFEASTNVRRTGR